MRIFVQKIPDEGLHLELNPSTKWLVDLIKQAYPSLHPQTQSLSGNISLLRFDQNVQVEGHIHLDFLEPCDRCGVESKTPVDIPFSMLLSPLYESRREKEKAQRLEKDLELTKDDLEFSFFENDEVNLEEILREILVLEGPTQFICSTSCKGVCLMCGQNLNLKKCACDPSKAPEPTVDPRWAALKNWKSK